MTGERRVMQEALFYGFSLERHVPDSHLLRKIDRFLDLSEVRAHLGPYYSDVGRPSIDPELMIRMLIVGYGFGNYLIDLKHAVIVDVEATTTIRQAEVGAAKTMLDRTAEQFDLTPSRLVADGGYGSADMVSWLVDDPMATCLRVSDVAYPSIPAGL